MKRFRRLRASEQIRTLVRETFIKPSDFIYPIFVTEGEKKKNPISSMPGIFQYSVDMLDEVLKEVYGLGISGVLIFGIPANKDEYASEAYSENGIAQKAVRYIKRKYPDLLVAADVCLCEYMSHGHCGVVKEGIILNDETLPLLCRMSVSLAEAGADIIAPSDMMDGRVGAIRNALDKNGFADTVLMSYSVKYASGYYSPFREAAESAPCFGDRKTYQMDSANIREALRETQADIEEGADIIMVKPALAYLDVVKEVSQNFNLPLAAYNVSGEYSMVKAAAQNGWVDERKIVTENLTAMKRAGADILITYHAVDMAKWLGGKY